MACEDAGITVTLPKPMTSGTKAKGRFGKQDFVYLADEDVYRCPAGEKLNYRLYQRGGWPDASTLLDECVPDTAHSKLGARRPSTASITRWEHEHVLEAAQKRLDENPQAMRTRRETVEHPFGTLKMRMGATHFLMKRCRRSPPRWRCTCSPTI